MASSIGPADRRHATVRPVFRRVIRPASDSTSRCFITAGKDIANGSASSLTDRSFSWDKRASNARRVGSDSAAKVRSSNASLNLTMRLSIETRVRMSRTGAHFSQSSQEAEGAKGMLKKDTRRIADRTLQYAASRWRTTDYTFERSGKASPPHSRVTANRVKLNAAESDGPTAEIEADQHDSDNNRAH